MQTTSIESFLNLANSEIDDILMSSLNTPIDEHTFDSMLSHFPTDKRDQIENIEKITNLDNLDFIKPFLSTENQIDQIESTIHDTNNQIFTPFNYTPETQTFEASVAEFIHTQSNNIANVVANAVSEAVKIAVVQNESVRFEDTEKTINPQILQEHSNMLRRFSEAFESSPIEPTSNLNSEEYNTTYSSVSNNQFLNLCDSNISSFSLEQLTPISTPIAVRRNSFSCFNSEDTKQILENEELKICKSIFDRDINTTPEMFERSVFSLCTIIRNKLYFPKYKTQASYAKSTWNISSARMSHYLACEPILKVFDINLFRFL